MNTTLHPHAAGTTLRDGLLNNYTRLLAALAAIDASPALGAQLFATTMRTHARLEVGEAAATRSGAVVYVGANLLNAINVAVDQGQITNEEANATVAYIVAHCFAHAATKSDSREGEAAPTQDMRAGFDAEVAVLLLDFGLLPPTGTAFGILKQYGLTPPTMEQIDKIKGKTAAEITNASLLFPLFGETQVTAANLPQAYTSETHGQPVRDSEADEVSIEVYASLERMLSFGSSAGFSHRLFYFLTHPMIDAEEVLRGFLQQAIPDERDYALYDHRKLDAGLAVAKTVKVDGDKNKARGALCIDTSGSISFQMISAYCSVIRDVLTAQRMEIELDVYFGDDGVNAIPLTIKSGDLEKLEQEFRPHGGGGTDFRPFFDRVKARSEAENIKFDFLAYCTDLCGTFPEADPGIPTIWLTTTESEILPTGVGARSIPFGTIAYIAGQLL